MSFAIFLESLISGEPTTESLSVILTDVLNGQLGDAETAAILVALRMRGERGPWLAAGAKILRQRMTSFETGRSHVLDTCGTGGDGMNTFNISTAAAIVAAAAGVPVVKHGNRAVSSQSGSADVLAHLDVPIEAGPAWARRCLDEVNLAFCFAPAYHPVLGKLRELRKRLGVRTIFNLLGPLANPARAEYQVLGVGRVELLDPMAEAVAELGVRRAMLVSGTGGLDEVSLAGPTQYRWVEAGRIHAGELTPAELGLPSHPVSELVVTGPAESAAVIENILAGRLGPPRDVVVANAAVGLYVAERAADWREGVLLASQAIDQGKARAVLTGLREMGAISLA